MIKVTLHKIIIIINLFYCNQTHPNFRLDEKILIKIIHIYIPTDNNNNKIEFIIYYKKFKTSNLVVNNNSFPPTKIIEKKPMLFINLRSIGRMHLWQ